MKQTPKLFSTVVPGGMDLEEWSAGGFSTYIHGDGSCNREIEDAINSFKTSLLTQISGLITIDNAYAISAFQEFINNYKPKN